MKQQESKAWIVEWRGYALHFHTNVCGQCYDVVAPEHASRFATPDEARAKAMRHGLQWNQYCQVIALDQAGEFMMSL